MWCDITSAHPVVEVNNTGLQCRGYLDWVRVLCGEKVVKISHYFVGVGLLSLKSFF